MMGYQLGRCGARFALEGRPAACGVQEGNAVRTGR